MRVCLFRLVGFTRAVVALFLVLSGVSAQGAKQIENLYTAAVPLADRSAASQSAALKDGLAQVLVRYTGYSGITDLSEVAEELQRSERYIVEYGVDQKNVWGDSPGVSTTRDFLNIRFNASQIDAIVNRLELPIWPTLRPNVGVLVLQSDGALPSLTTAESAPEIWQLIGELMDNRGLAYQPLLPQELSSVFPVERVWAMDSGVLSWLKQNTEMDLWILVRVRQTAFGDTDIDYVFLEQNNDTKVQVRMVDTVETTREVINRFVDEFSLSRVFIGGGDQSGEARIRVYGLVEFSQYRPVFNAIQSLEQVANVHLASITDQYMDFVIAYRSDRELLLNSIQTLAGIERQGASAFVNEGIEAYFLPGAAFRPGTLETSGERIGVQNSGTQGAKSETGSETGTSFTPDNRVEPPGNTTEPPGNTAEPLGNTATPLR